MKAQLLRQGKVRDIYAWGNDLLLVASDRISAFDVVLPNPIPQKGVALTQLSRFWFEYFADKISHHVISFDLPEALHQPEWNRRTTWCKRAEVIPMECVVRGYLAGSGWKDYETTGKVQGHALPKNLNQCAKLPEPIFTPTTKADAGHDMPLTEQEGKKLVGETLYDELKEKSLFIYKTARDFAEKKGIIIADTKFEFGIINEKVCLIDELLTPDSSRFWPMDQYTPGKDQPSFDKQFVRNYLLGLKDWNRQPPAPELPVEIIRGTQEKYFEAYQRLTGRILII
ncbi:MAG: phosphoribosylaminoimidazolesuccinocarboxamide synthase [Verrucomicrobiota bacterium]